MHSFIDEKTLSDSLDKLADGASPSSDYERGVRDVLHLLGLVNDEDRPSGEISAMVLNSLRVHVQDGVQVGLDWNSLNSSDRLRGADLLRVIEETRAQAVADPTPGRVVRVTQAVIKSRQAGIDRYLMQYDALAGRYQPIGGKVDPGDADSEAGLRREIYEELELDQIPGSSKITLNSLLTGWGTVEPSATYGLLTGYTFDFFHATAIHFPLPIDADTRWLTRREIVGGQAGDGRAISPIYEKALGWECLDGLGTIEPPG